MHVTTIVSIKCLNKLHKGLDHSKKRCIEHFFKQKIWDLCTDTRDGLRLYYLKRALNIYMSFLIHINIIMYFAMFKYPSFCESNTEIYSLLIPEIDIEIR